MGLSSWIQPELAGKCSHTPKYCCVLHVVDLEKRIFCIADDVHSILSTMTENAFQRLTENYNIDVLGFTGALLAIERHFYRISSSGTIEMVIDKSTYLGEGPIPAYTRDINEHRRQTKSSSLCPETVFEFLRMDRRAAYGHAVNFCICAESEEQNRFVKFAYKD